MIEINPKIIFKNIKNNLNVYGLAITNEIAIDANIFKKINKNKVPYLPVRPLKTLSKIELFKINGITYHLISLIFLIFCPLFFFYQMIRVSFRTNKKSIIIEKELLLNASTHARRLSLKVLKRNIKYLNINQENDEAPLFINNALQAKHLLIAYLYSILATYYLYIKIQDKKDILQSYVAFNFFLVLIAMNLIKDKVDTVYFCNHYDRWAVLFDNAFHDKNIILIQHGMTPDPSIALPYLLTNIKKCHVFNKFSQNEFKHLILAKNSKASFKITDRSLLLSEINHKKKTILIIGQPHSAQEEVNIINKVNEDYIVYIKPHPNFSSKPYTDLKHTILITDKSFYPKVDIALSYESTLGIEYEASGIKVIWWKGMEIDKIIISINKALQENIS